MRSHSSFYLPKLGLVNKVVIGLLVGLFVLDAIVAREGITLWSVLGLSLDSFSSGMVYQVVTYPFYNRGVTDVLFSGLIIWFIGSELEHLWGNKRYIQFLLATGVGGAVLYLLLALGLQAPSASLAGMGTITTSLLVGYALLYPDRQFLMMFAFPVKAKYFCMILIAIQLYGGFFGSNKLQAWAIIGAMAIAWAFLNIFFKKGIGLSIESIFSNSMQKKKDKKHLRLIKDDDDEPKIWQ